jgi:hypothetical protein
VGIRRILGFWNKLKAIPRNSRWIPNEIGAAIFRVKLPFIFKLPIPEDYSIKNPVFGRKTGYFLPHPSQSSIEDLL